MNKTCAVYLVLKAAKHIFLIKLRATGKHCMVVNPIIQEKYLIPEIIPGITNDYNLFKHCQALQYKSVINISTNA